MAANYVESLPTSPLMTADIVRGLFSRNDWLFQWWSIPGLLFLFVLGVGGSLVNFARDRDATLVILLNCAVFGGATAYTYRMDWNRYLVPLVPFVMLLAAGGVTQSLRMLRDLGRPARCLGWVVFAVVATAGLSWIQSH
jgi:CHASE2 domain-containing sensor protein